MGSFRHLVFLSFVCYIIEGVYTLECYVCHEQDSNDGKCLKTIKTCEPEHDMCLTEIKWGTTPYWQAGAQKQFYISKRCATKSQCDRTMKKYTASCTHVWYEDWKCAECCGGDKCNYFIISSSPNSRASFIVAIPALLLHVLRKL